MKTLLFKFRSLMCPALTLCKIWGRDLVFILFCLTVLPSSQLSQHSLLDSLSFPLFLRSHFFYILKIYVCVGLFLDCFLPLVYLIITVLIPHVLSILDILDIWLSSCSTLYFQIVLIILMVLLSHMNFMIGLL